MVRGDGGYGSQNARFRMVLPGLRRVVAELAKEAVGEGEFFFFVEELGLRGEDAEGGVMDDLLDGFGGFVVHVGGAAAAAGVGAGFRVAGRRLGEVEGGDLEAVEEEAGAAGVDAVAGDAAEDLTNGALDGGAVFGEGEVEGVVAALTVLCLGFGEGLARGVVEVTKFFSAEAWTAATVSLGVDVTALEALGLLGWL